METTLLLRLPAVIRITGLARSTIYKLMSEGNFPSSLKLTQRTVAWSASDIQQWIESRARTRWTHQPGVDAAPATEGCETRVTRLHRGR
jgi:prophage regulatory protein